MKLNMRILLLATACLLGLAQIFYSMSKKEQPPKPVPAEVTAPSKAPSPVAADVTRIVLAGPYGNEQVILARRGSGWVIETLYGAPADASRVERFLDTLLGAEMVAPPDGEGPSPVVAGTGPNEGITVSLGLGNAETKPFIVIGLRPEDSYDSVYARPVHENNVHILSGDLRGDMGVWRNSPDAVPESGAWLETRVLTFDPHVVESVTAIYPDHRLEFVKNESGVWVLETQAPGGSWSVDGFTAWLAALSEFRITDAGSPGDLANYGLGEPTHSLVFGFPEGETKSIEANPDRSGDGMWIKASDYPGLIFHLPAWRFHSYFQRVAGLFPNASPEIALENIRFIDIRRSGESVKLSRREDGWLAIATQYPLRTETIDRLARLLSELRPLDYADPSDRTARPYFGGPLLEVTLDGGEVHQYRLGGRHPVFPWLYVQIDGTTLLAIEDADAGVLFPEFSEFLDLGRVFSDLDASQVTTLKLSLVESGDALIAVEQIAEGEWEVTSPFGSSRLLPEEVNEIVNTPLQWRVNGFGKKFQPTQDMPNLIQLEFGGGGAQKSVVFLPSEGREIPYLADDGRSFLVDRAEFFAWLAALRSVNQRLDMETAAKAAKAEEEARKALEAAEAEAVAQAIEAEKREQATEETPHAEGAAPAPETADTPRKTADAEASLAVEEQPAGANGIKPEPAVESPVAAESEEHEEIEAVSNNPVPQEHLFSEPEAPALGLRDIGTSKPEEPVETAVVPEEPGGEPTESEKLEFTDDVIEGLSEELDSVGDSVESMGGEAKRETALPIPETEEAADPDLPEAEEEQHREEAPFQDIMDASTTENTEEPLETEGPAPEISAEPSPAEQPEPVESMMEILDEQPAELSAEAENHFQKPAQHSEPESASESKRVTEMEPTPELQEVAEVSQQQPESSE